MTPVESSNRYKVVPIGKDYKFIQIIFSRLLALEHIIIIWTYRAIGAETIISDITDIVNNRRLSRLDALMLGEYLFIKPKNLQ